VGVGEGLLEKGREARKEEKLYKVASEQTFYLCLVCLQYAGAYLPLARKL